MVSRIEVSVNDWTNLFARVQRQIEKDNKLSIDRLEKAMSSITSGLSENTIKLDYLGSPVSHVARSYSNIHADIDAKSVGSKSVGSRTSKLTYSGRIFVIGNQKR